MGLDSACFEAELHGRSGIQDAMTDYIWHIFFLQVLVM